MTAQLPSRSKSVLLVLLLSIPTTAGVMLWLLHVSARLPAPGDALRAESVLLIDSSAREPASLRGQIGTPIVLPHDWREGYRGTQAWYVFRIDLQVSPDRLWGVLIPFVEQNAMVFLNGSIVGRRGEFDPYPSRFATTPLYFALPNGLIRSGRNEFAIKVQSYPQGRGYLGPVLLGSDEILAPIYERSAFVRSSLLWFFIAGSLAMTFIVAFIAWRRRAETLYRWFALQFLLWTLLTGKALLTYPIVPPWWLDAFGYVVTTWFCTASFLFAFRFMDTRRPGIERAALTCAALGAIATVIAAAMNAGTVYVVGPISTAVQMAIGLAVMWVLVARYRETRDPEFFLVVYAGLIIVIFGTANFRVSAGAATPVGGQYLLYATPLILGAFVVLLLNRFVRALENAERSTTQLEQRVAEKSAELVANYDRLRTLERERVLAMERERIMREMHDGIGGQLISSIARLRRADGAARDVRVTLEDALTDLRLMIDSLEDVDGDLNVVFAMLRQRLQPQLEGAGLAVDWRADELPAARRCSPEVALHLMRIVQEALANVVRHAAAQSVSVSITHDGDDVVITIADDGRGLPHGDAGNGRGMSHMRRRAEQLSGTLTVERLSRGTRVGLRFPVRIGAAHTFAS